jgi:protein SCO1/2
MNKKRVIRASIVVLTMVLGLFVTKAVVSALQPHLYAGTVLRGDKQAQPLEGIELASGAEFDISAQKGKVVLLYFGYTNCPDICPTTLSTASSAIAQLPEDEQDLVQLVMVSVDPERDDAQSLQEYVQFFDEDFLGATGSREAIDTAASLYGVFYELGEGSVEDGYVVDHTATLMGVDPSGVLRVVWPPDISADLLGGDIADLVSDADDSSVSEPPESQVLISVADAWARPTAPGVSTGAFYMDLQNDSDVSDRLVGVSADLCSVAEIHSMTMDDGVMSMGPATADTLEFNSDSPLSLEPGGHHIMCMGLSSQLTEGAEIDVELEFETADPVQVKVIVGQP